ncbi:hypothetical protein B0H14DRAFT_2718085, partial [Mycena olivaceomarginata]
MLTTRPGPTMHTFLPIFISASAFWMRRLAHHDRKEHLSLHFYPQTSLPFPILTLVSCIQYQMPTTHVPFECCKTFM